MWPVLWSIVRPCNYKQLSCKHAHDFTGVGQHDGEGHHFYVVFYSIQTIPASTSPSVQVLCALPEPRQEWATPS